jgi:site-specific DNA-methyltransferase (adenine-specific)
MTPYFSENGILIFHGDCREILPTLEPVDVVIADPPYSEHVHTKNRRGVGANSGAIAVARDLGFESLSLGDLDEAALEISRLTRRWALVFSDVESCHLWHEALTASTELRYVRTGIWLKSNTAPQFTGDRPAVGFETITICHPEGRMRWNGGGRPGVWEFDDEAGALIFRHPIVRGGPGRVHTAQKPLTLMKELIGLFSEPGEVILDPFMGSGTTLCAAKALGRHAIGIEIEERYCELAVEGLGQDVFDFKTASEASSRR